MLNKLDALKYFCIAAETLQFRETAIRMSVSPQVVTRIIAELEAELGSMLFIRNTRNMQLTEFGVRFLEQAKQYLLDGEKLFTMGKQKQNNMSGIVRITTLLLPINDLILNQLAQKCALYPDLRIDWRVDSAKLHLVENQIDIGIRMSLEAEPQMIARQISQMQDKLVISPQLLTTLGKPKNLADLHDCFPISNLINVDTGRAWGWPINEDIHLLSQKQRFITNDPYSELSAALAGMTCALLPDYICNEYIKSGQLVELFDDIPHKAWNLYVYRPQRTFTSTRVLTIFDWLTDILRQYYKVE